MRDRPSDLLPRAAGVLILAALLLAIPTARAQLHLAAGAATSGPPPDMPVGFALEDVTGGGPFEQPVAIAFAPGGRMFVAEKEGRVWVVRNGERAPAPLLDLRREVLSNIERGLLGIAVDPNYAVNGHIYLNYTVDHDGTGDWDRGDAFGRVTRYTVTSGDRDVVDPATRHVLLGDSFSVGIPACHVSHAPAMLAFGSDGMLLVGTGDGANFTTVDAGGQYPECFGPGRLDPSEDIGAFRAQRIESLAGKILRVDPETGLGLPSNPFYTGDSTANASRVWAMGVRNSFRFAVRPGGDADPDSARPGTVFAGEVGWQFWEELNVIRGGENTGWPCWEGPEPEPRYQAATPATNGCAGLPTPSLPTAYWHHFNASLSSPPGLRSRSVIAGAFAGGTRYPEEYRGRLFLGDYIFGWMATAAFDEEDGLVDFEPFSLNMGAVVQAAYDPASEALYFVNIGTGRIERLRHASESGNQPPVAVIDADTTAGTPPLTIRFSAAQSTDPERDSLAVTWTFGDGGNATGMEVEHVYMFNGTFEVVATVRDSFYAATATIEIVVDGSPPDLTVIRPAAGAAAVPGSAVALEAQAADPDGSPVLIAWRIHQVHNGHQHSDIFNGEGPATTFVMPRHGDPGDVVYYLVTAVATDASGQTRFETTELRVEEPREVDVLPEASLIARVPSPVGAGSPTMEVVRDGIRPPSGSTNPRLQFDTFDGQGGAELDWFGLEVATPENFRRVEYQEGLETESGGWFESMWVEVRQDGAWIVPQWIHALPVYRAADGVTFDRYALVFAETTGDALRVIGEAGGSDRYVSVAELQAFSRRESSLPPPWTTFAVGASSAGAASASAGTFSLESAGGFDRERESFRYVYQALDGDGAVTARLASRRGAGAAGLVLRTSLADSVAHAAILARDDGIVFRHRAGAGEPAEEVTVDATGVTPVWLRLLRTGAVVSAFTSDGGTRWSPAGAAVVAPGARAYAGLAVAGAGGTGATATFDGVEMEAFVGGALPAPWGLATVGPAPAGGGAALLDGTFVVAGRGEVGGQHDAFDFLAQPVPVGGMITARLDGVAAASAGAEAGLMVRGGLDPTASFAMVLVRDDSLSLRYRPSPRAPALELAGPAAPASTWLRLAWGAAGVTASWSADGEAWTVLPAVAPDLGESVHAGMMVSGTSLARGAGASGVFSSVLLDAGAGGQEAGAGAAASHGVVPFGVRVRPNPSRGRATVDVAIDRPGRVVVEVLDVLGRRVIEHRLDAPAPALYALPIDAGALPAGVYVVRAVHSAGERAEARMIVVR